MPKTRIVVTIEQVLLDELDRFVAAGRVANRSQAMERALAEKLERLKRNRLGLEAAKLDVREEKQLAEEGLGVASSSSPVDFTAWEV